MTVGAATIGAAMLDAQSSKPINIGIIGLGNRSGAHVRALQQLQQESKVVALCDIRPDRMQKVNEGLPEKAELYTKDAMDIVRETKRSGRIVCVGMQKRYSSREKQMMELVDSGKIGQVRFINYYENRNDWNAGTWKYTDPATGKTMSWRNLKKTCGSSELEFSLRISMRASNRRSTRNMRWNRPKSRMPPKSPSPKTGSLPQKIPPECGAGFQPASRHPCRLSSRPA